MKRRDAEFMQYLRPPASRGPSWRRGPGGLWVRGRGTDGRGEPRPAGAAVVLVERREERLARDHVHVQAGLVVVPVLVAERRLGAVVLRHLGLGGGGRGGRPGG